MLTRFTVAVLFVGLLSVVPSVGGMDVIQVEKGPATNAEYASVNTCCWKTYTSEAYGFEMKYPQELAMQEGTPERVALLQVMGSTTTAPGSSSRCPASEDPDLLPNLAGDARRPELDPS